MARPIRLYEPVAIEANQHVNLQVGSDPITIVDPVSGIAGVLDPLDLPTVMNVNGVATFGPDLLMRGRPGGSYRFDTGAVGPAPAAESPRFAVGAAGVWHEGVFSAAYSDAAKLGTVPRFTIPAYVVDSTSDPAIVINRFRVRADGVGQFFDVDRHGNNLYLLHASGVSVWNIPTVPPSSAYNASVVAPAPPANVATPFIMFPAGLTISTESTFSVGSRGVDIIDPVSRTLYWFGLDGVERRRHDTDALYPQGTDVVGVAGIDRRVYAVSNQADGSVRLYGFDYGALGSACLLYTSPSPRDS